MKQRLPLIVSVVALLVAIFALLAGHLVSPELMGYGGTTIFGCEDTGKRSKGCEYQAEPVTIAPGSTGVIWTLPVPSLRFGEQLQIVATTSGGGLCDGAPGCNGFVQRRLICTITASGVCLDSTLDASDVQLGPSGFSGLMADASAFLSSGGSPVAVTLTGVCPAGGPACSIGATISVNRIAIPAADSGAVVDSGGGATDSGTDSGTTDSGAGPLVIVAVQNNIPNAAGGEHATICYQGASGASPAAVLLLPSDAGVVATLTSCSYSSSTTGCPTLADGGVATGTVGCTYPAYTLDAGGTGLNPLVLKLTQGTSTGQTSGVIPTLADGGAGQDIANVYYLGVVPDLPDGGTLAGEFEKLLSDQPKAAIPTGALFTDLSANGVNYAQATGGNQPSVTANWQGGPFPAITGGAIGGTVVMTATEAIHQYAVAFVVGNFNATTSTQVVLELGVGGSSAQYFILTANTWGPCATAGCNSNAPLGGMPDTKPHVWMLSWGGTGGTYGRVDGVNITSAQNSVANSTSGSGTNGIENNTAGSAGASFNLSALVVMAYIPAGDQRILDDEAILRTTRIPR